MKKSCFIILLGLFALGAFSMSRPSKEDCITGKISYVGNEPFVRMIIVTEKKESYGIQADDDLMAELRKNFGKKIDFYGELIPKEDSKKIMPFAGKNGTLKLTHFEVRKK